MKPPPQTNTAKPPRIPLSPRAKQARLAILVLVAACIVSAVIYSVFFFGIQPGPSFIQELRTDHTALSKIRAVQILKSPLTTSPFTKHEYAALPKVTVTNQTAIADLLQVLETQSSAGRTPRNHPGTVYGGIFAIDYLDGRLFYVYYVLECDQNGYFVVVNANSANSTNPNGATAYENTALVRWLQKNDPWFQSIKSVPITTDERRAHPP
jgi:hypothetical protein